MCRGNNYVEQGAGRPELTRWFSRRVLISRRIRRVESCGVRPRLEVKLLDSFRRGRGVASSGNISGEFKAHQLCGLIYPLTTTWEVSTWQQVGGVLLAGFGDVA